MLQLRALLLLAVLAVLLLNLLLFIKLLGHKTLLP